MGEKSSQLLDDLKAGNKGIEGMLSNMNKSDEEIKIPQEESKIQPIQNKNFAPKFRPPIELEPGYPRLFKSD